jgi:hypothetical protein
LKPLKLDYIEKEKNSDTLFILGSGSSINQISEKQWNQIEQHDSIGYNFWLVHDFIPDYYKFELDLSKKNERTSFFYQIFDEKWDDYKNKTIIYNHFNFKKEVPKQILCKMVDNQIYYPKYIYLPGKDEESFHLGMKYFNKLWLRESYLFSKRGSITMLISFALYSGYKKIILCGIDLNNTDYFYDDDYYLNKYPKLNSGQKGKVHMSFDETLNPLTIDKIILSINNMMIQNDGKHLFVLNKSSGLYPLLQVFN